MSNESGSGPDLFFAGGECFTRHGVPVRHTALALEDATKEVHTRNSTAQAWGRDGILRPAAIDVPRIDWLSEVDLDPTRNVLPASGDLSRMTIFALGRLPLPRRASRELIRSKGHSPTGLIYWLR
jgi:hypothetical protein